MSGSTSYSVVIDRASAAFTFFVSYTIPAYIDPETGETFAETAWIATYRRVGESGGSLSGYGWESETVMLELGLERGAGVKSYVLEFSAMNTFSAVSVRDSWNVFSAAYDTTPQIVSGTDDFDVLIGGSAGDVLTGRDGDDVVDAGGGGDVLNGGDGADRLIGGAGNDFLLGGAGDDTLDGGPGGDAMAGDAGNDTFIVDSRDDYVTEAPSHGIDIVRVAGLASYTLGADIEDLATAGSIGFAGTGNRLDNRITGGPRKDRLAGERGNDTLEGAAGDDVLTGGVGADVLRGGDGVDTASYADSSSPVTVSLVSGAGTRGYARGDALASIENLEGSDFNDVLTGDGLANGLSGGAGRDTIAGGAGADVIEGGAGADILDGGAGADTLSHAGSARAVSVDLAAGSASGGDARGDRYTAFENVTGSGGDDVLAGDDGANTIRGGAGADRIDGRGGDDTILGGAGADALNGGGGSDTVSYGKSLAAVSVNLLAMSAFGGDAQGDVLSGFENAAGGSGDDTLNGDGGANALWGSAGADALSGFGGDDRISGGAGADVLDGGAGIDTLRYGGSSAGAVVVNLALSAADGGDAAGDTIAGFENVEGSESGDMLSGDDGANMLFGRAGNDRLDGGRGNDALSGGAGDDAFVFGSGYGRERITDFLAGDASGEVIWIALGSAFDTFDEVMAVARSTGPGSAHTVFDFDRDTTLTLQNTAVSALTASDFLFV